ncbi:unnamed protein product [Didymodactylos carnosus]|uniref:Uncharacterized protein n=1 Tax=Didymodactylos carnosus TaxID=1234261 RepID=A0A8S2FFB7_9BILA|nr:unnamed protein product [Didymodactylos carnosus]CAF4241729.1 unnamed protein product [Didymodactylos carnosus]
MNKLLITQTTNLIDRLHEDIEKDKKISEETRATCRVILQQVRKAYLRLQIRFFKETKTLIDAALGIGSTKRQDYYQAWSHLLDCCTAECENLIGPLLQVSNSVARISAELKIKWNYYLTGCEISMALGTGLLSALFVHFCPFIKCTVLAGGGVVVAIGGAALAALIVIGCSIELVNIKQVQKIYDSCTDDIRLMISEHVPFFNKKDNIVTATELRNAIHKTFNKLKMTEAIWKNDIQLQSLQRRTQEILNDINPPP